MDRTEKADEAAQARLVNMSAIHSGAAGGATDAQRAPRAEPWPKYRLVQCKP